MVSGIVCSLPLEGDCDLRGSTSVLGERVDRGLASRQKVIGAHQTDETVAYPLIIQRIIDGADHREGGPLREEVADLQQSRSCGKTVAL